MQPYPSLSETARAVSKAKAKAKIGPRERGGHALRNRGVVLSSSGTSK